MMDSSMDSLSRFVGGNVETMRFAEDCRVICNGNWKKLGLQKNMKFVGREFGGPVVFTGYDGRNFCGLTEDQAQIILRMVKGK